MNENGKTAHDVTRELTEFAKRHGLIVAAGECLARHARRFVELGRCPCVEGRPDCPCDDVLDDLKRLGRCECGILIDPARICVPRTQNRPE